MNELEKLFALAPLDAEWVSGDGEYFYKDSDGDWVSAGKYGGGVCVTPYEPVEIPARERSINIFADGGMPDFVYEGHPITHSEIKHRRALRHPVSGIETRNKPDSISGESQAPCDSREEMMAKSDSVIHQKTEQWMPEIGEVCELSPFWYKVTLISEHQVDGVTRYVYWDHKDKKYDSTKRPTRFRPLQSKRERFALAAAKASNQYYFGDYFTTANARNFHDWLVKQGVDLSPLLEGE